MVTSNEFKRAILAGERQIGIWSNLASTMTVEIVAGAGYHWVVLDAEHGPSELTDILAQLQAISRHNVEPVVRVPTNDRTVIKKYMDIGARSFLIPFVETVEEARDLVAATRYPPLGVRGVSVANRANNFGRVKNYLHTAHEQVCLIAQIESAKGLENLPAIMEVEGLDAIFIGPSDLAASLGHLGDAADAGVRTAIAAALAACQRKGKPMGTLAPVVAEARHCFGEGYAFVAVGSDMGLLARGSEALRAQFNDLVPA